MVIIGIFATKIYNIGIKMAKKEEHRKIEYAFTEISHLVSGNSSVHVKRIQVDLNIAGCDYSLCFNDTQSRLVPIKIKGEDEFEVELRNIVAIVPLRDNEHTNARRGGNKRIIFANRKPGILVDFKLKCDISGKLKLNEGELVEVCNGYFVNRDLLRNYNEKTLKITVSYLSDDGKTCKMQVPVSRRKLQMVKKLILSD